MGDRTWVNLTTLAIHKDIVEPLAEEHGYSSFYEDGPDAVWEFHDVDYGNLDFLKELQEAGVSYQSDWGSGSEFGPGSEFCWFDEEGDDHVKVVNDNEINPDLGILMTLLDEPEKLIAHIKTHQKLVETPSRENQEEYGKRFLTQKLIAPNG
jgi:hypothetical protein